MNTAQNPTPDQRQNLMILQGIQESLTFEYGTDPPDRDWSLSMELTQYKLHVEEGQSAQKQHHDVRDQEGS